MGSGTNYKGARKNKSEGGGEVFIAFFTSHRSPLSERLEQAKSEREIAKNSSSN